VIGRTETYDPRRHLRQNYAGAARKHPSLSPSPLDEAHRARILSANIIRLDKFGHPCARGILDHVAGVEDLFLAKATYDAACKKMIILLLAAPAATGSRLSAS
jgi:hypothetical protein